MQAPPPLFAARPDAGRALAAALAHHRADADTEADGPAVVLGLARGGVPVAREVATALRLELDVFVVRKLGLPGREELAMGALAHGAVVLNPEVVGAGLVDVATLEEVAEREAARLASRERAYRSGRRPTDVAHRHTIIVDDGVATGSSMFAAIGALRELGASPVTVAVPVAPARSVRTIARAVDEVVCLYSPRPFVAVGRWYEDFTETTDDDVRALLRDG